MPDGNITTLGFTGTSNRKPQISGLALGVDDILSRPEPMIEEFAMKNGLQLEDLLRRKEDLKMSREMTGLSMHDISLIQGANPKQGEIEFHMSGEGLAQLITFFQENDVSPREQVRFFQEVCSMDTSLYYLVSGNQILSFSEQRVDIAHTRVQ